MYNVARYLPDFMTSIERQTVGLHRIEVIAVDDGSDDDSLAVLERWRSEQPDLVTVLTQSNAGQASARNRGLDASTGDWVSFIDPDDWIADDYFEHIDRFIEQHPTVSMVACNRVYWEEAQGRRRDGHPLRHLFSGDRLVDLKTSLDHFHTSAPAAVFRRQWIDRLQLRFDPRIRPHFEDGHFCVRYLLNQVEPTVGFLESAEYHYRRRADNTSTLQGSLMHPGRFVDVPRHGYLDVLTTAEDLTGAVPRWLQALVIYELSWYFSADAAALGPPTAGVGEVGFEFVEILREIRRFLDDEAIRDFAVRRIDPEWRDALLYGVADQRWHSSQVNRAAHRGDSDQVELSYYFTDDAPDERLTVRGAPATVIADKVRSVRYFGQQLLRERIVWVAQPNDVRVSLDGQVVPVRPSSEAPPPPGPSGRPSLRGTARSMVGRLGRPALQRVARVRPLSRRFAATWLFMDTAPDGTRSAENVFRYLRSERRDLNAYYAAPPDAPQSTLQRLERIAPGRILRPGTMRWRLALIGCQELITSGPGLNFAGDFRRTYVANTSIDEPKAAWLESMRPDVVITTFRSESEALLVDGSTRFTDVQVRQTGSPSLDSLTFPVESLTAPAPQIITIEGGRDDRWNDLVDALEQSFHDDDATSDVTVQRRTSAQPFEPTLDAVARLATARVVITDDPDVRFYSAALGSETLWIGPSGGHPDGPEAHTADACCAAAKHLAAGHGATQPAKVLDGLCSKRLIDELCRSAR